MRMKVLLGKLEEESMPTIVGCIDAGLWELLSEDETRRWWDTHKELNFGPEQGEYDYREITVSLDDDEIKRVYEVQEVEGKVEKDDSV